MNKRGYVVGRVEDVAKQKGWFFGHFMDEELLQSDAVEVAYQDISGKKSQTGDAHYHKRSVEINLVVSGSVRFEVGGDTHTVTTGGYYILYPGTVIRNVSAAKHTRVVVIRFPSVADKIRV